MDLKRQGLEGALAAGALAIVLAGPTTAHAQSVLRLAPQADLKILDTVQTTNNITTAGQFFAPIAYRKNLSGILETPRLVLWNIEKK